MGLDSYLQRTQLLLNDSGFEVFNPDDLTTYINMARGQVAGQAECVRVYTTLSVSAASQQYTFSTIAIPANQGIQGYLNARQISYAVGSGQAALHTRAFPYFNTYILSQVAPDPGPPAVWSQFGQGAAGTIFLNLLDGGYVLSLDMVAYPIPLTVDSDVDAIPYQWSDAVPFFAAYFAALAIGDSERAKRMYEEYGKFLSIARGSATPSVLPTAFAQAPDPFARNRLGIQPPAQ